MIEAIRRLSPRAEFLLVNAICFADPILGSVTSVLRRSRGAEMSDR